MVNGRILLYILIFFVSSIQIVLAADLDRGASESSPLLNFTRSDEEILLGKNSINAVQVDKGIQDAFVIYQSDKWRVTRTFPVNHLAIELHTSENGFEYIDIDSKLKKDIYPIDAVTTKKGDLILVGYDVFMNVLSGRKLTGVKKGLDFFIVDATTKEVKNFASGIPISGMDNKIYIRHQDENVVVCAISFCYTVGFDGSYYKWAGYNKELEIVEAEFISDKSVAVILRRKHDDRFPVDSSTEKEQEHSVFLKGLITEKSIIVEDFEDNGIPYGLKYDNGVVYYKVAEDIQSYRDLLEFDFSRMNNNGMIDLGSNNLEGRIAWSQAYYLNGLMALIDNSVGVDIGFDGIEQRVISELTGILASCFSDYPYFYTQRYSIDREPVLYALHLGKISALINRGTALQLIKGEGCLKKIKNNMVNLSLTVEKPVFDSTGRVIDLQYGQGFPFWADGANVPYNYISGYVDGFFHFSDYSGRDSLLNLLVKELFDKKPYPDIWNYWGGIGNKGWKKNSVSVNTVEYLGNKDMKAHITYRTMDAAAIINCFYSKLCVVKIDKSLIDHFKLLTRNGKLLPSINDTWVKHGIKVSYDDSKESIIRFARSANHWEFYSQIFVLEQMAKQMINE